MQTQTSNPSVQTVPIDVLTHALKDIPPCATARASGTAAAPSRAPFDQEQCARQYAPLVHRIARYVIRALPHSVDVNDLIQLGMMGLLDAAKRYSHVASASFATFAAKRIRGAILDGLRRADSTPRRVREQMRRIEATTRKLEHALQRRPSAAEIASELGWPLAKCLEVQRRAHEHQSIYLDDVAEDIPSETHAGAQSADPLVQLLDSETVDAMRTEIARLPERERKVLELYYFNELKLREIGGMLGLSEARVCQLLRKSIDFLRTQMRSTYALAA